MIVPIGSPQVPYIGTAVSSSQMPPRPIAMARSKACLGEKQTRAQEVEDRRAGIDQVDTSEFLRDSTRSEVVRGS